MLTYYELIELRDKLTNEDISLEHAKKYFGVNSTKVKKLGIQKIGKIEELKFSKTNVKYVVAEKHLLYSIFPTPPKKILRI